MVEITTMSLQSPVITNDLQQSLKYVMLLNYTFDLA